MEIKPGMYLASLALAGILGSAGTAYYHKEDLSQGIRFGMNNCTTLLNHLTTDHELTSTDPSKECLIECREMLHEYGVK